ncbi:hypothetical protein LIER_18454 [Lithospermum erythrorhizon]|uniref:Uncharacterized protein n=1 Tax=Lithospermum erythrorhizon TaxID=34254 RepID=A0AAV3QJH3_LITER
MAGSSSKGKKEKTVFVAFLFLSAKHQTIFKNAFLHCSVFGGRSVALDVLKQFSFYSKIKTQKWFKLLALEDKVYPDLGFNKLLGISHSGVKIGLRNTHILFDKKEAHRLLGFSENQVALKSKDLSTEHKFLHYIEASSLVQRTRNYDKVTPMDLMVMYFILKEK